jgi:cyclopropane fatty-acyl-phospholipid synthase-like methyltransferase
MNDSDGGHQGDEGSATPFFDRTYDEGSSTAYYDRTYGASQEELTAAIREAAFGEDIGQFSWTTADEHRRFQQLLGVEGGSHVLDVACGSGGPALFMARETGCRVTGVDIHEGGVAAANEAAEQQGLGDRARFRVHDARMPFPFDDGAFDALISIDSINHVFDRAPMFGEWRRVLRPGGRVLYTDAVVVTGPLRREEILARSGGMGEFVFTPYGADRPLLEAEGFADVAFEDVTDNIVQVSRAWHAARERVSDLLDDYEGEDANATFQSFLATVHRLASERRLSRLAYSARTPS